MVVTATGGALGLLAGVLLAGGGGVLLESGSTGIVVVETETAESAAPGKQKVKPDHSLAVHMFSG